MYFQLTNLRTVTSALFNSAKEVEQFVKDQLCE